MKTKQIMTILFLSTLLACSPIVQVEDSVEQDPSIKHGKLLSSSNRSILFYNV